MFLADENACPNVVNKWECLFLKSTSCEWPESVLNCQGKKCGERGAFSNATALGVGISSQEISEKLRKFTVPNDLRDKIAGTILMHSNETDSITEQNTVSLARGIDGGRFLDSHFIFGVMVRYNSAFLRHVLEMEVDFRMKQSPVFHAATSCVAVHVRRDDRAIAGVDMIEWCKNHTSLAEDGRITGSGNWIDGVGFPMIQFDLRLIRLKFKYIYI